MKYSLRSLMIAVMVGPPLLALAIVFTPQIWERLFPQTSAAPPAVLIPKAVPIPKMVHPLLTRDLNIKLEPIPKERLGDFNTPPPALQKSLDMDRSPSIGTTP